MNPWIQHVKDCAASYHAKYGTTPKVKAAKAPKKGKKVAKKGAKKGGKKAKAAEVSMEMV